MTSCGSLARFLFILHLVRCESQAHIKGTNQTIGFRNVLDAHTDAYSSERAVLQSKRRVLEDTENALLCDSSTKNNPKYQSYFDGMKRIYKLDAQNTCLQAHIECGWPAVIQPQLDSKKLPLLVLSVGLEGAGHHLWTEILDEPVFDCVWKNARHYRRDIGDGVSRTTPEELEEGITDYQISMNLSHVNKFCCSAYNLILTINTTTYFT